VPVPRLLGARMDPDRDAALLLLEDIQPAERGNVLDGLDAARAERLLEVEARMHADFWQQMDRPDLAWLLPWDDGMDDRPGRTAECLPRFLASHGDRIPARARRLAEEAPALLPEAHAALRRAPVTLVHADLHAENVLFS
jgi:Ser/Thr protein kinase RdoA (MazF antagonist)